MIPVSEILLDGNERIYRTECIASGRILFDGFASRHGLAVIEDAAQASRQTHAVARCGSSMHEQPVLRKHGLFDEGRSPVVKRMSRLGLCQPNGLALTDAQQNRAVAEVPNIMATFL
ncbi:hypothetical protein BH160DRAFT_3832 [Burkholderia sp. H160]|nr:hypothetical protein BH160DRAFT_3832 [Burkholderia sp. H160]